MGKNWKANEDKFWKQPVYGDDYKYIKTKIKIYADSMVTNFHNKKNPKERAPCKCLSITMLDSVIKVNKKILSSNIFRRMKICARKDKKWELYWWWFKTR